MPLLPGPLTVALIGFMAYTVRAGGLPRLTVAALAVAGAGLLAGAAAARPSSASALADHPAGQHGLWRVRGELDGDPQRMLASWTVDLQVDAILVDGEWKRWTIRVRTAVYDPIPRSTWRAGDRFEAFLRLRSDRPGRNPVVSPRPPIEASGADVRASLKSFRQLRPRIRGRWRFPILSVSRAALRRGIERRFGNDGPLLRALLLGERGEVPTGTVDTLARTGLIHLIAISGLHVGVAIAALFGAIRLAGIVRPQAALACLVALPFLYGLVVPRPAVARACLMAALLLAGMAIGRRTSSLYGLVIATLALSVADPWVVRNTGFQLSTAATGSILLLSRASRARLRLTRIVIESWIISCAASVAVAPILAATTHRLPLVSVPLNLAAVPAMSVALITSMASLAADACGAGALAAPLARLAGATLRAFVRVAEMVDGRTHTLSVPGPAVPWIGLTSLALVVSAFLWHRIGTDEPRSRRLVFGRSALAAACGLSMAGLTGAWLEAPTPAVEAFRLVAFDIGQGDALLVETPTQAVVVDTGGSPLSDFDPGASILAPALRARGVERLQGVAITHLHADHAGGLRGLLREIPADGVWVPSMDPADPATNRLLRDARMTPVLSLASGHALESGPCAWSVLHPSTGWLPAGGAPVSNNGSLVLSLGCAGRSLLLTGDTEAIAERAYPGDASRRLGSVLKSPHHGSDTSSTAALLDATQPRHVIISAGWRNRFGLPDEEILERYRRRQIAVYRTDRDGAVTLSAGTRIRVRGERWSAGRGRYRVGGWLD